MWIDIREYQKADLVVESLENAKCEAMWARMKEELLYHRYKTINMNFNNMKQLIWRYYMSYWNNRRICSAIGGIPPIAKEKQYYDLINKNNNVLT